jgi:acetyl esterase/lipase
MLFRVVLLVLALVLLSFASLTTVRVPVVVNWRLALLAGEFGHWFVILPIAVGGLAWWGRGPSPGVAGVTLVLCVVATVFFLKPTWQAAAIARTLPGALPESWRAFASQRPAFSLGALFGGSAPAEVLPETHTFGPALRLDYYRPSRSSGPAPCVVMIHGGGWDSGDPSQLPGFNHWLAGKGYAVAAISYRLAPAHPWPAQRDDTHAALAYLKAHAVDLGLDPTRFVLCGRSAGGQIAAAVGYTANDPAIRGVIALYAPFDMRFVWSISRDDDALNSLKLMTQYLGGPPTPGRAEVYDTASAQMHVRRGGTPPTLLVHGVIDTLVWQRHSERLSVRLAEEGVPHYHLALPWAVHALEYNLNGPAGQLTAYAVETFLAANLGPRNGNDRRAE